MPTASPATAYRAALALALFTCFALVWTGLGVGIIGADGARANLLYGAVLLVGLSGAFVARLQADGLARTLVAMALTQGAIALLAVRAGWGMPHSPPAEVLGANAGFVALFLAAAWLFRRAARGQGRTAPSGAVLQG